MNTPSLLNEEGKRFLGPSVSLLKWILLSLSFLGFVLVFVDVALLALSTQQSGFRLLAFIVMWIALILCFVPFSAVALCFLDIVAIRQHKRIIIASWVYLVLGGTGSILFELLFPNSGWITSPLFVAVVLGPVLLVFYRLVYREIVEDWRQRQEVGGNNAAKAEDVVNHGSAEKVSTTEPIKADPDVAIEGKPRTMFEENLWTKSHIVSGLFCAICAILVMIVFPGAELMTGIALVVALLIILVSPYKVVLSSERFEVKDLVNLFGWRIELRDISRITPIPARNRIRIIYSYHGKDRARDVTCTKPKLLAETLKSIAPHIQTDTAERARYTAC